MSIQDFTSQVDLSRHLDAIPFLPAKPAGFRLLSVAVIDTKKKYERRGDSFLPTEASYLDKNYIQERDHAFVEILKEKENEPINIEDFGAVANKVFKFGGSVSGGDVEIEASLHGSSDSVLLLLHCKKYDCTCRGLIDFLKRNVAAMCESPFLQNRLGPDPRQPDSRRALLAIVVQSIKGHEHSAVVRDSGAEGKVKVSIPKIPAIGAGASHENAHTQILSQKGVIGIVVAIMKLEMSPATQTVRVMPNVPFIQRVDDDEYDKAVSWQKMPFFLKRFTRRQTTGFSFVLGETIDSRSSTDFEAFHSAREGAAQEWAAQGLPGDVVNEGDNGHAILRGEPLYSPQRFLRGSDIHFQGSMNFLYKASLSELESICSKLGADDNEVWGFNITSVTPAVPFDDAEFVPIHYTMTGEEDPMELPGAILRYEGNVKVLVPIDPMGNGMNSKEAVTASTSGWEVRESIMYVDVLDTEWKQELETAGYHHLADSEANVDEVERLGLKNGQFIVMGRHELVNLNLPDDDGDGPLSREHPWGSYGAKKVAAGITRSTVALSDNSGINILIGGSDYSTTLVDRNSG